ncbi:MAG: substrate-binding domain-containing protein [Actinomycetota bacterium]
MTVSRVVNSSGPVAAATRERVQASISTLGYLPNGLARGLSSRRTKALGVIVPDVANPFFTLIVRGAESVARRAGFRTILCNSEGNLEYESEYIEDMLSHQMEGIIIAAAGNASRPAITSVIRRGVPVVLVDRAVRGIECDIVQGDSFAGARQLTEHLIRLGHRGIAMINESVDVSTARDRYDGYVDALRAASLPLKSQYLELSAFDGKSAYRGMQHLLGVRPRPTAVFAANNFLAVGAIHAIRDADLRIPEDIAVVCFDDIEHAGVVAPFLTVMAQPAETFGTLAAQLLIERIVGRVGDRRRNVVLPADFIIRTSCGASVASRAVRPEGTRRDARKNA